jgi:hypothetical protein
MNKTTGQARRVQLVKQEEWRRKSSKRSKATKRCKNNRSNKRNGKKG